MTSGLLDAIASRTPASIERFAWWVTANGVASTIAASQSYLTLGAGLPRLVVDGLVVGMFQGLALWGLVRFRYWPALTLAALGLAGVAGIATVVAAGLVFAFLMKVDTQLYVFVIYGLGAAVAGLVGGFVQSIALPPRRRILSWLLGSACGAPFLFPSLLFSVATPAIATSALPAWALGLLGGLAYGAISGIGLLRSLRPVTSVA